MARSRPSRSADIAMFGQYDSAMLTRRAVLQRVAVLSTGLLSPVLLDSLAACGGQVVDPTAHVTLDVNTETGLLNFVYAVLQLEADFYARVMKNKFSGMLVTDVNLFGTWRNDTTSARDSLKSTISTGRITDAVLFNLGHVVDFLNRASTLAAAQTIEDVVAQGFTTVANTLQAWGSANATMVSDFAVSATTRSDTIRTQVLGMTALTLASMSPAEVMATFAPYYLTTFTVVSA